MLSSSIQATLIGRYAGHPYGESKKAGEELFFAYSKETGAKVLVYRFPNLFGKWCRPNYNSAVATFCNNIANDLPIQVNDPSVELYRGYHIDVNICYSEHERRYLNASGVAPLRTYVSGSPMAEVLHNNLPDIEASDILDRLNLEKGKYILLSAHREENIDTEKNFLSLFNAINAMAEKYDMPILYSCHPRSRKRLEASGFELDRRVIAHEPLGFHDYNNLQMNSFAVVNDSDTLPKESSFFLSIGKPVVAMINGEGADLIKEADCGWSVPAEDPEALANLLLQLSKENPKTLKQKSINGKLYSEKHFRFKDCMDNLERIINFRSE